uniref:Tachylectin 2 domain-containing protein n=1 Tax=Leptobrachium leishanense TaxID=445787 RepID=A0A8C5W8Y8_9ANUR
MSGSLLFIVKKGNYLISVGLPPSDKDDSYIVRTSPVGTLTNATKILFSPDGELFAVCGGDLYRGPMPSKKDQNWFDLAKKVGKLDWGNLKFLLFDPQGVLYAVTNDGDLYKGPAPINTNMSWLYRQATKIGSCKWNLLQALFFDPEGALYAVKSDGCLVKGDPPTGLDDNWFEKCISVSDDDWSKLTYFISFNSTGELWCINNDNGYMYKWPSAEAVKTTYAHSEAQSMGRGFLLGLLFAFATDKIICSIEHFEFIPDSGVIVTKVPIGLRSKVYKNKEVPMKDTFSFSQTLNENSRFTQIHGFAMQKGAKITFAAGVPCIEGTDDKITINSNETHIWNFTETNVRQASFSETSDVTIAPQKCIRVSASVTRAEMDIPYRARVRTMSGNVAAIEGMWKGTSYYNLKVDQEDFTTPDALLSLFKQVKCEDPE